MSAQQIDEKKLERAITGGEVSAAKAGSALVAASELISTQKL